MGCSGSRFDEMPVVAHPHGLKVLPGSERWEVVVVVVKVVWRGCNWWLKISGT